VNQERPRRPAHYRRAAGGKPAGCPAATRLREGVDVPASAPSWC